jgi:trk system potassium uptake protein TrkH
MNPVQTGALERIRVYRFSSTQLLTSGFAGLILLGSILLMLPAASATGRAIHPLDAVFTAVSAVCVTGLIVLDTPVDLSHFGQTVVLVLIQIGGLGYMTVGTILLVVMGKRIGLQQRMVIQETLSTFTMEGLIRFIIGILVFTFTVELAGAVVLGFHFAKEMPPLRAAFFGVFHAVSAFNNAGFALFSNSLMDYRTDPVVNAVILVLIVLGGVGFLVYRDVWDYLRKKIYRFSLHTKVVIVTTTVLLFLGWAGFWLFEYHSSSPFRSFSLGEQAITALFQSVTVRTAGFNTVNTGSMGIVTLYLFVILMFIGGSPGSTAGGIKTTTVAIMAAAIWSTMRGREDTTVFYRRISNETVVKAAFLAAMGMIFVSGITLLLLYVEGRSLVRTLFEVVSAAGTVGLSTGNGGVRSFCALFSDTGKMVIMATMFLGRIGPLAIGISAVHRAARVRYRYPQGKIMIG